MMNVTMDVSYLFTFEAPFTEDTRMDRDMGEKDSELRELPPDTHLFEMLLEHLISGIVMVADDQSFLTIQP